MKFKISIRFLFAAVTLIAVFFAWGVIQSREQKAAVRWVTANGGKVEYDFERRDYENSGHVVQAIATLLDRIFGPDLAHQVTAITFESNDDLSDLSPASRLFGLKGLTLIDCPSVTDAELAPLRNLNSLEYVVANGTSINGEGLQHFAASRDSFRELTLTNCPTLSLKCLSELTTLNSLDLRNSGIADSELSYIKELKQLEYLDLTGNMGISNEGLKQLVTLPELAVLQVLNTQVDDGGLTSLLKIASLRSLAAELSRESDLQLKMRFGPMFMNDH